MDVFSLLKFWRNAGIGHPNTNDFDTTDDEGSFFDLVFTNNDSPQVNVITSGFHSECDHYQQQCSKMDGADLKSSHTYYSSPHTVNNNNNNNNKTQFYSVNNNINNNKPTTPRSPFRVLMLGFHSTKSKSGKKEMKCEIEEVTISSLLKRDHSLGDHDQTPSKRFSKDVVHRYLNLIKPLVSRRSNQHSSFYTSPRKEEKASVFKEVRKHLGKSRSSSSSSSFVKPTPSPVAKRDDSAFQQQDGIQSAILHCKKSYNSPSQGCNVLSRSGSAPSQGCRISVEEEKRSSI